MPEITSQEFNFGDLVRLVSSPSAVVGNANTGSDIKAYLHTGSLSLDWEFVERRHRGGYPSGRMVEIFGSEAVGKTTLITHAMVSAQQGKGVLIDWVEQEVNGRKMYLPKVSERKMKPGLAILIDSECKFPLDRAQRIGLDVGQLVRIVDTEKKALTFEQCIERLEEVLNKIEGIPYFQSAEVPIVVVLDSLAQAPVEAELEGNGLQDGIATKARKIRMSMRRMVGQISRMNIFMLFTNHIYARIGTPGSEVSGGRGLKLAASLRLGMKKAYPNGEMKTGENQFGIVSTVDCAKSSYYTPPDEVRVPIRYLTGIDNDWELMEFFLDGKACVDALHKAGHRVELVMPDGAKKSCWAAGLTEMLDSIPGSRDYLIQIFERTMRGEKGEKRKKGATDSVE